jgi:hypothetical protein
MSRLPELQAQLLADFSRRAEQLPAQLKHWTSLAAVNQDGMGIHQSQIRAVELLLSNSVQRQTDLAKSLQPGLSERDFSEIRRKLESELVGSNSLMATFRYILDQRNASYGEPLRVADLVAASCYLDFATKINGWLDKKPNLHPAPPLTFLNARLAPAAITRKHTVSAIGLDMFERKEAQMPISVISIPFPDAFSIWSLCSVYHEVGHLFERELGLNKAISAAVTHVVSADTAAVWGLWSREIIADAFGVVFGGPAYTYSLAAMLLKSVEDTVSMGAEDHPSGYVRAFLAAAMLRSLTDDFAAEAANLEDEWTARYTAGAGLLQSLRLECSAVANAVLNTKIEALGRHALRELNPYLAAEAGKMRELAGVLRGETSQYNGQFRFRYLPGAAQFAALDESRQPVVNLAKVHGNSVEFAREQAKNQPQWLADEIDEEYLTALAAKISFADLNLEE